jgi:protein-tyrosine-phosphatase
MSLLSDYEQRTAWKYEPVRGAFPTHEGLENKVGTDGSFTPFAGSTVVFRPGRLCMQVVPLIQRALAEKIDDPGMFAAPLPASTIHMTLHDLICPEQCDSDPADRARYYHEISASLRSAAETAGQIREKFAGQKITMVSDRIVPMVSKSLVLLLKPAGAQDEELMTEMYRAFDGIRVLPYALTPHITLAYFRPGIIDGDRLGKALDCLQIRPENAPVFEFDAEALTVQKFRDMRTYADVPERICMCCDGGLNRSVIAAHILNHLAKERDLPVACEARSAYPGTQGKPVPDEVWKTLEAHGIRPDRSCSSARYLEEREYSHFTSFAAITDGAVRRLSWMRVPDGRVNEASRFFHGVSDPEYGEISHEQAFAELRARAEKYLEEFEKRF